MVSSGGSSGLPLTDITGRMAVFGRLFCEHVGVQDPAQIPTSAAAVDAVRARVPIEMLRDTIQPFPTFSEIYVEALKASMPMFSPDGMMEAEGTEVVRTLLASSVDKVRGATIDVSKTYTNEFIHGR